MSGGLASASRDTECLGHLGRACSANAARGAGQHTQRPAGRVQGDTLPLRGATRGKRNKERLDALTVWSVGRDVESLHDRVPCALQSDHVAAPVEPGLLTVTVPTMETATPRLMRDTRSSTRLSGMDGAQRIRRWAALLGASTAYG